MLVWRAPMIAGVAALAALALPYAVTSPYHGGLIVYAAVLGLFATSVNLVYGYLGFVTFGQAAFFGLGAYTAGLLAVRLGVDFWLAAPLAMIPGAALGALVGFASLRLGGAYFAIASLTVAEVLRLVASNWMDLTRGPLGMVVPASPFPLLGQLGMSAPQAYLAGVLLLVVLLLFMIQRLIASPYGRAWLAIRESQNLAESIGIETTRYRVINVAFAGAIASLAGVLLVPKIFVITPDLFGPSYSATGLLAVILGGRGTLLGPLVGGAIFAVLPEVLRFVDEIRIAIFAVLLLIVVRFLPGGLVSLRRRAPVRHTPPAAEARPVAQAVIAPRQPGSAAPLLKVTKLSKAFRGLQAMRDLSFEVRQGEVLGLIGPNGAGKTTCLNLLCGFIRPDSGSVVFAGTDLANRAPSANARIGLVRTFQQTTLFAELSVRENVLIATHLAAPENALGAILGTRGFRAREAQRQALAGEVLASTGLEARADAKAGSLAYGEQRLLAIALALAARPRLLLLDEPAAGLNHTEAMQLVALLHRLRDQGLTILIIDHNLKMMMAVSDRIVALHHGEMLAEGTPAQVREHPDVIQAYLGGRKADLADATHPAEKRDAQA
jgi:branched-chain amino acid transport system permease protein